MKGRRQAIVAVVLTSAIPPIYFLSPVIVGLVILRKGMNEAFLLLLTALLPMALWSIYPSMVTDQQANLLPYLLLFSVSGLALALRAAQSWQLIVLLTVIVGLVFEFYLRLQPATVDVLMTQLNGLMEQNGVTDAVGRDQLIALIAMIQTVMALLLLIWCRWLQSMLYNPGGFRQEFHSLRIDNKAALLLVLLLLLSGLGVLVPETWYGYFSIPFMVAGVALVHATVALKQMSPLWLFVFYAVIPVIGQLLVLLALADSWYDFRKHMRNTT
ncbi:MAG: hypothetical protein KJN90_08000 [Gammaproteobacteria bacterium]|nr:hypothetical protein [Gammaproteobacteria bacterium]